MWFQSANPVAPKKSTVAIFRKAPLVVQTCIASTTLCNTDKRKVAIDFSDSPGPFQSSDARHVFLLVKETDISSVGRFQLLMWRDKNAENSSGSNQEPGKDVYPTASTHTQKKKQRWIRNLSVRSMRTVTCQGRMEWRRDDGWYDEMTSFATLLISTLD